MIFALYIPFLSTPREVWVDVFYLVGLLLIGVPMIIASVTGAPFVGSPKLAVDRILQVANVKKGDRIIDPACGDGRYVVTGAVRYGAKAVGYEMFLFPYLAALIRNAWHRSPATIYLGDGRKADYRNIDVVMCYLLPEPLKKWKLIWEKQLPKGARVISYAFKIDGWKTVAELPKDPKRNIAPIWMYEMGKQ